ncbi:hypothetical protein QUF80_09160 [Desulfococcaceae bacterium HSG8]|nr:hypothetical protein [Desulfococcaceae bacterium HSG8]
MAWLGFVNPSRAIWPEGFRIICVIRGQPVTWLGFVNPSRAIWSEGFRVIRV